MDYYQLAKDRGFITTTYQYAVRKKWYVGHEFDFRESDYEFFNRNGETLVQILNIELTIFIIRCMDKTTFKNTIVYLLELRHKLQMEHFKDTGYFIVTHQDHLIWE